MIMIAIIATLGMITLALALGRDTAAIRATRAGAPTHTDGQGYLTAGQ